MRAAPKIATFVVLLVVLALSGLAYAADRTTNMALTATGSSTQGSPFVNAL
jgi:preprotein translocase subunit SecE